MKPIKNWNNIAPSGSFSRLQAGGYIVKITEVIDHDDKEYLELLYDIAEGPEAGRFTDPFYADKPYAHRFSRFYTDRSIGDFRGFIQAIDASNGTKFDEEFSKAKGFREQQLVGKLIGIVLREEEYLTNRGDIKTKLEVSSVMSIDRIREGKFTVPDVKPLKEKPETGMKPAPEVPFANISDEDIPF